MKRLFSILLAIAMILGSFVAFAEETVTTIADTSSDTQFSDIQAGTKTEEAVTKLVAHGIIAGYPDGTFKPDGQITRAEFAAVITRFKGIADNLAADAVTGFADLDADTQNAWARPYVKAAVDAGIINGFEDGTYRASEPVTYEQAIKMIICAAGYEVIAQSELSRLQAMNAANITWSSGYIAAASKHGVTAGAVSGNVTQPATRGIVAILTSNAVELDELKIREDGSYEKVEPEEEQENIKEVKGIVSGTYYTGIEEAHVDISENEIMIGTGSDQKTYELSESVAEKIDLQKIIGKNVVAYYDTLDRQITSITERNNTSTVIDEASVISINGDTIKYYDKNDNKKEVSLSGYTIIYNGKYVEEIDLEETFENGTIELISAAGKKIAKVTSYEVLVINSKVINNSEEKLNFKYGKGSYTFPARDSDKPELYFNGEKKEFASALFAEWYVINFMESPEDADGNSISRMYITNNKKTDKVVEISGEDRKVGFSGGEVVIANSYADYEEKVDFEINYSYTYYLDHTGQLAAVNEKAASSSPYYYGYLVAAGEDYARIIKNDGTLARVTLKSKVRIDGANVNSDDVLSKLEETAFIYDEESDGCAQPIKYYIVNDELAGIDTVANKNGELATTTGSNGEDSLVYNAGDTVTPTSSKATIDGSAYNFNSSTLIIYVPENRNDTESYSKLTPSQAFSVQAERPIEILGADTEDRIKYAAMVLIYGDDPAYKITGKTPYFIVTNANDETIEGYKEGATTPTPLTVSEDKFATDKSGSDRCVDVNDIGRGDIIRYVENNGKVIAIEMIYDVDDDSEYLYTADTDESDMNFSQNDSTGKLYVKYAEAVQVDETNKKMYVTTVIGSDSEDEILENSITYTINSNTVVYRLDGRQVVAEKDYTYISTDIGSSSEVIMIARDQSTSTNSVAVKAIYIAK